MSEILLKTIHQVGTVDNSTKVALNCSLTQLAPGLQKNMYVYCKGKKVFNRFSHHHLYAFTLLFSFLSTLRQGIKAAGLFRGHAEIYNGYLPPIQPNH